MRHWFAHKASKCTALLAGLSLVFAGVPHKASAIAGLEGTFEFGLDAPWRIEPSRNANGNIEYGAIPIQITIHGAMDAPLDNVWGPGLIPKTMLSLGLVKAIRIRELGPVSGPTVEFPLNALHEVERTNGAWPWPVGSRRPPRHELARIWAGDDPEPLRDVTRSSEWHATLWYTPRNRAPGTHVALQIEVILERPSWAGQSTPLPPNNIGRNLTLRNFARVYLAPEPMPRFDSRWLYGDFHYHGQGTDNEGESGYNYRGVVRAMGAMGLDFVFATDHASNSEQIIDADLPPIRKIFETAASQGGEIRESNVKSVGGVARDMNIDRYAFAFATIYGRRGVNAEAALGGPRQDPSLTLSGQPSFGSIASASASSDLSLVGGDNAVSLRQRRLPQNVLSYGVVPQIFLGGELDAIPEAKIATIVSNTSSDGQQIRLPYGNGLTADISKLCSGKCTNATQDLLVNADGENYLIRDFQSLDSLQYFGRAHLVYFPSTSASGAFSFIPSNTSRFGGATRRLMGGSRPLLPEIEQKGVAFIAHHMNSGAGRGPDGVPWTREGMLLQAFQSPAILGFEFWNEDVRQVTRVCSHDFCKGGRSDGSNYLGYEEGYERKEDIVQGAPSNPTINQLLRGLDAIGINLVPGEYHNLALPLGEVRRGFVSGGPNGGLFQLYPFNVTSGGWQSRKDESASTLYHGTYDWDMMNLRGLDLEANATLRWLPPREPRRMFMSGGSDGHGDLNYRRAGYFLGTEDANDTAIGKPRNLVFAGTPAGAVAYRDPVRGEVRRYSQEQIIDALRAGHFSVTDGPAIRIAIDRNGNNVIDDGDVQMGDVFKLVDNNPAVAIPGTSVGGAFGAQGASTVTLLTEVVSSQEFGPLQSIGVYVGVHPEPVQGRQRQEPRLYTPGLGGGSEGPSYTSNGHSYVRYVNNYWAGASLGNVNWQQVPGAALTYRTTLVTKLSLNRYEVAKGVPGSRFFVRATTSTITNDGVRYGFTNPIWILRSPSPTVAPPTPQREQ